MARVIGNVSPADDHMHPLGPEPNFNESMYFNFFDPERQLGGFVRLGNRANEGRAEMTVCLFLPDGRVLFAFKRPEIAHNDAFDAGGLRFEVLEAGERLRTSYVGGALELREPRALADPGRAFRESPRRRIVLDLEHVACGPMYGRSHDEAEARRDASQQFARAHYEQHMRVRGTLELGDGPLPVSGHGLRDHSWGPRHWQAIDRYEWLTMNFGDDLGVMVTRIETADTAPREGGVVVRGEEVLPIEAVTIEAEYEPGGLYHRAVLARARTRDGASHRFEGRVRGFVPLRNRREGRVTHIGEGMTEWRYEGRTGSGLSEFLRQVE